MKIPIFPGKYHQNGGFSMAMLVSGRAIRKKNHLQQKPPQVFVQVASKQCFPLGGPFQHPGSHKSPPQNPQLLR